jgi:hypothetical protein
MIGTWVRRRRALRRRPVEPSQPDSATVPPASKEAPVAFASAAPAAGKAPADDPRLELYLQQIADLPAHDRAIIVGVLQSILDDEAAYARRVVSE